MSSKINISIPKPCHENWQEMSPLEKGRFCGSCQKQVFDFTKFSDREIIQKFNSDTNICGRFLTTQLNRDLAIPKQKSSVWVAGVSVILSFLSLGNQEGFSQEVKTEQVERQISAEKPNDSTDSDNEISGNIIDQTGPLPGSSVLNLRTNTITYTDLDGNFKISAEIGDEISISNVGYESQLLTVKSNEPILVRMKEDGSGEVIIAGMVISKRKTFFGRIFRSIGNIFK